MAPADDGLTAEGAAGAGAGGDGGRGGVAGIDTLAAGALATAAGPVAGARHVSRFVLRLTCRNQVSRDAALIFPCAVDFLRAVRGVYATIPRGAPFASVFGRSWQGWAGTGAAGGMSRCPNVDVSPYTWTTGGGGGAAAAKTVDGRHTSVAVNFNLGVVIADDIGRCKRGGRWRGRRGFVDRWRGRFVVLSAANG